MTYTPGVVSLGSVEYNIYVNGPVGSGFNAMLTTDGPATLYLWGTGEGVDPEDYAAAIAAADAKFQELIDLINDSPSFNAGGTKKTQVRDEVTPD